VTTPDEWANPVTTRSKVVLEIASELVAGPDLDLRQATVLLSGHQSKAPALRLSSASTVSGIRAVAAGEADLAIVNPSAALSVACRGHRLFGAPLPLRTIAVIPSLDQFVFAVRPETGLERFEDIAERRPALKVGLRGVPEHSLHFMLEDVASAAGFSVEDLRRWGGETRLEGSYPAPGEPKFEAFLRGEIDAIFDEAADFWIGQALEAGMRILPLAEATVRKLEAQGYRRAVLEKSKFPALPSDILTIDFSGWSIFVRADLPDRIVAQICAGLDARKHMIPWQGDGPLPVERMCRDAPDTPLDVPLHPAAERFWRERGYIR
jgi:TRAP-type uncharacterized transport system substrate-binding protein